MANPLTVTFTSECISTFCFVPKAVTDGKFIQLIAAKNAGQTYERYGYVFTLDANISIYMK
ncbi:hypothetical protein [Peribacillus frigoritolerans]|uniref:Uncharacterized protein n=1 Tax=Peribacillus castrilensis TaxID=2897690 RepID=A0AAW9NCQ0_9BACI|nr:hypothetical protein [Peribacillus castrilensis]